jgi:hypothetical protein
VSEPIGLFTLLKAVWKIGEAIFDAISSGDRTSVDEVLPDKLKVDIVAASKEIEARQKFGPRPS